MGKDYNYLKMVAIECPVAAVRNLKEQDVLKHPEFQNQGIDRGVRPAEARRLSLSFQWLLAIIGIS